MVGSAACNRMIAADKCTFTSALKSGSLRSGSRAGRITPALWITIVTAWSRVISAAARLVASASARSTCTCLSFACASPEGCTSRDTTSWPASSRRFGRAIAKRLLDAGHEVVSLDVQPSGLAHAKLKHVHVDLADAEATKRAAAEITRDHAVTMVIHNAGVIRPALLPDFNALVNVHLSAAIILLQAALPTMRNAGYGRVVLVSSRAVLGLPTRTSYSATKAGMLGMARTWALELAPHGVTVNVVAPGPIQTANFHSIVPEGSPQVERVIQTIPVKRLGQPDDVARAVMFFAERDAGFVTGQVLYVCGGTSVGSLTL